MRKGVRRRRVRTLIRFSLLAFLLIGVGIGLRWSLQNLKFFSIKEISIVGEPSTLSKDEILRRVDVNRGENLFAVDLNAVQKTLQDHEFFKKINVHRSLPQTLVIEIEEYRPELVLYTGRSYYVDAGGEIFKDITETQDSRDYVIFTGITEEMVLSTPHQVKKQLRRAIDLKKSYLKTEFAEKYGLSEVHFEKNIGFTLYPEQQKYSIKFGIKDFGEKTKKLTQVLEKLNQSKVKFSSIDLNYPGKVLMTL